MRTATYTTSLQPELSVEDREAKLQALRETLDASIARGGSNTVTDLQRVLDAKMASSHPEAT